MPIKLQTNSQLNLISGMEVGEATMLMQRVIDGELDRGDLREECLKRNAFEDMRKNAINDAQRPRHQGEEVHRVNLG